MSEKKKKQPAPPAPPAAKLKQDAATFGSASVHTLIVNEQDAIKLQALGYRVTSRKSGGLFEMRGNLNAYNAHKATKS